MKKIMINRELCTACLNCSIACMLGHSKKCSSIYDLNLQDIENEARHYIDKDHNGNASPIFCQHCQEPECVMTCMSGAMTKDEETGLVLYDAKKCGSCLMCIMSCPYGILKPDEKNKSLIIKCNRCDNREIPRCVESCQTNAIYLDDEVNDV